MSVNKVSPAESYIGAIKRLLPLAQSDTSGSRAAAQVLLSAYNGDNWQLDITDLCVLDDDYYQAALLVMHYRRALSEEPHTLITNGDQLFSELQQQWKRYHINNRHKSPCKCCEGTGTNLNTKTNRYLGECNHCGGSGLVTQH